MSDAPMTAYLAQVSRRLTVDRETRAAILDEIRGHLEEAAAHLEASGVARPEAEARAVANFGGAGEVAARFNAVHPVHWDIRRTLIGVVWGILVAWFAWTFVTYPFLVHTLIERGSILAGDPLTPQSLFFQATPLAFGFFSVLSLGWPDSLLMLCAFLAVFGIVPFLWGRRAGAGWRPGLAFGLGVIVGFPWVFPAIIRYSTASLGHAPLLPLLLWLPVPYAMLASWLGQRTAGLLHGGRWAVGASLAARVTPQRRARLLAAFGVVLVLVILGANVWSWGQAASFYSVSPPTVAVQLRQAQAAVPFTIRQPTYLPAGLILTQVDLSATSSRAANATYAVNLVYLGPNGARISISETTRTADVLYPEPPDYLVSDVTVTGIRPVWWLGSQEMTEHQINLDWSQGDLSYGIYTNGHYTVDVLKAVAASLGS